MKSTNNRIELLRKLMSLEERRADTQTQLEKIDSEISSLQKSILGQGSSISASSAAPAAAAAPASRVSAKRPGRPAKQAKAPRGSLKESILNLLSGAGSSGLAVKEIAQTLSTKPANIHAWFHSTGKRIGNISKIGSSTYRLSGGKAEAPAAAEKAAPATAPAKPAAKAPKAKPAKAVKAVKAVKAAKPAKKAGRARTAPRGQRGALSAKILGALKAAGSKGITLSELSDKVGAKYKNISIWFATTGKRQPGVQKIAPGTYAVK